MYIYSLLGAKLEAGTKKPWGSCQLLIKPWLFGVHCYWGRGVIVWLPGLLLELAVWLLQAWHSKLASWAGYCRKEIGFLCRSLQLVNQSCVFYIWSGYCPVWLQYLQSLISIKRLHLGGSRGGRAILSFSKELLTWLFFFSIKNIRLLTIKCAER